MASVWQSGADGPRASTDWPISIQEDLRQNNVMKVVTAIFADQLPATMEEPILMYAFAFASAIEEESFRQANSRDEYFRLLTDHIFEAWMQFNDKKQLRVEQWQRLQLSSGEQIEESPHESASQEQLSQESSAREEQVLEDPSLPTVAHAGQEPNYSSDYASQVQLLAEEQDEQLPKESSGRELLLQDASPQQELQNQPLTIRGCARAGSLDSSEHSRTESVSNEPQAEP